jgi:hypothetical protein
MTPIVRISAATLLFGASLLAATPARAQESSARIAGEALFDEGRALVKDGKLAEACVKFAESQRVAPAIGTLLNLGDCYEKTKRFASAWAAFREAAALASHGQDDRATYATDRAKQLDGRIARLKVNVPESARVPGLEVRRGDHALPMAEWGVAIPVDEGTIAINATAPGKKPWSTEVVVGEAETKEASVAALADAEQAPPSPTTDVRSTPEQADPKESDGSTQRLVGLSLGGLGVVGIVAGVVTGLVAKSKNDDALTHCTGVFCDPTGLSLTDDAKSMATVSTVGFIAGGVLLAGGAVLWFTAPRGARAEGRGARLQGGARLDASGARLQLGGSW